MDIVEAIKSISFIPRATTEEEALLLLDGVNGRGPGQFGDQLKHWLESNPDAFPEQIQAENIDDPNDRGVDVILSGTQTGTKVGFQIKSDNDLASRDFTVKTKAQITDSRAHGLALYVLIMACRPTEKNQQKYKYLQNEILRWPGTSVLFIEPTRAAGLLNVFSTPLPKPLILSKSWPEFFQEAGQVELASLYLDQWFQLSPDQRFLPPKNFDEIEAAANQKPLTIVIGPPAFGKTFSALQILWNAYYQNHHISWIAFPNYPPTEGPIPHLLSNSDTSARIEMVVRGLGLKSYRPPIDPSEFIVSKLEPNSTVFIEDPFGKTEDIFEQSLHSYNFFDIDNFLEAISSYRQNCHVLITSRENLFEKWLDEYKAKKGKAPNAAIIRVGRESYPFENKRALANKLLNDSGFFGSDNLEILIASEADTPYEIELFVKGLHPNISMHEANIIVKSFKRQQIDELITQLTADRLSEILFLFLLDCLSTDGFGRHNFLDTYCILHRVLELPGSIEDDYERCFESFRPFFSKLEIFGFRERTGEFHLEPIHSIVKESIKKVLREEMQDFLNEIATRLDDIRGKSEDKTGYITKKVAAYLFQFQDAISPSAEGYLFDALFSEESSFSSDIESLIFDWKRLSHSFKTKLFDYFAKDRGPLLAVFCSQLIFADVSHQDAWHLLRLLLNHNLMGATYSRLLGSPWTFIFDHFENIPADLFEGLNTKAEETPILFALALGPDIMLNWDKSPQKWKDTLFLSQTLKNEVVQKELLFKIGFNWESVPNELRDVFLSQMGNRDPEIRKRAYSCAYLFYEKDPERLDVYKEALEDEDVRIPLFMLHDAFTGETVQDRKFGEALLAKADKAIAACILQALIDSSKSHWQIEWYMELAKDCFDRGSELSKAVVTYDHLAHKFDTSIFGFDIAISPFEEPEATKLAWLWDYINRESSRRTLLENEALGLLNNLKGRPREVAHYYSSIQYYYLPKSFQEYLDQIKSESFEDFESVKDGIVKRLEFNGSRTLWSFPIEIFLES